MERIKSAVEIAMEKVSKLGELTEAEKTAIKDEDLLQSIFSDYFLSKMTPEGLWKIFSEQNKPYLLIKAQRKFVDSISLNSTPEEIGKRKYGILALETLKENQNVSALESLLDGFETLQKKADDEKEQRFHEFMEHVERDPSLRIVKQPVQTGQGTMMVQTQLAPDEAVFQLPEWKNFITELEKAINEEFMKIIERLKAELG